MASGNTLAIFTPLHNQGPATNYATLAARNQHPILAFDPATAWAGIFAAVLNRAYAGGGITLTIVWTSDTATTGNCVWKADWERNASGFGVGTDAFDTANAQSATAAAPATAGNLVYTTIAFTAGQLPTGLAVGEKYRLRIQRDATNAADTMAGNAHLVAIESRET
jgi:hypothetical protein